MPRLHAIVIDLGGTHLRAAYFDEAAPVPIRRTRLQTPRSPDPSVLVDALAQAARQVAPPDLELACATLVIGTPGPVDPFTGTVFSAPNIPGWRDLPLRRRIADRFPGAIHIANDANLAALGELTYGAGRGVREMLYLTLGTGIGGAVITAGRLLLGSRGLAAELGHVTVIPDGPLCGCGQRGHIEAVASGPAIVRTARARLAAGATSALAPAHAAAPDSISPEAIGEAARLGDAFALEVLTDAATAVGRYIADCLAIFAPERVILGGGLMALADILLPTIRAAARAHALTPIYHDQVTILPAELGDDAGLAGGLALCLDPGLQPPPVPA